jgi:hypothetical protein
MPKTSAPTPAVEASAPGTSSRPAWRTVSGRTRGAARIAASPTGTLRKNPRRHESAVVSTPPAMSPNAVPMPASAPQAAIALVRCGPSGKLVDSSASVEGARIAAPTPCAARAAIIHARDWARPTARDAAANTPMPTTNMRRRPARSPARAPSSSSPPNVRV